MNAVVDDFGFLSAANYGDYTSSTRTIYSENMRR